jgi:serpin B
MLYNLTKLWNKDSEGYRNPLKIANAIFVGNNVTLRRDFAQTFMDYYRGSSINVDFSSRDAVDAVNRWASQNTNGLIKDVVQEFDPLTVAALVNAIYFSDRWSWEFDSGKTKEGVFHAPAGDSTASFMIREGNRQLYYEDDSVQAVRLGYEEGGGMYIILPKAGGAAEFLASMTAEYFNEIRSNYVPATGKLLLPRFSVENDVKDLKETLEMLGVPLFDPDDAPITGLIEENIPLFVSNVMQKALVKVDEEGTTAAAVTVIEVGITSAGPGEPSKPFEMICDRPFVFILCENTYDGGDQILFTGVVNQP